MNRIDIRRTLIGLRVVIGLAFALPQAQAEVPLAMAEQLVRASGMATQLQQLPKAVDASIDEAAQAMGLPPNIVQQLQRAAQAVFRTERMQRGVMLVVARDADVARVQEALRWYRSADGRRVVALEDAAAVTPSSDVQAWLAAGNRAYAVAPASRRALLGAAEQAAQAAEMMAEVQIRTAYAMMNGLVSMAPPQVAAELRRAQQQLLTQRPQAVAAARGISLATFTATYAPLGDAELGRYVAFLKSSAGRHSNEVLLNAFAAAMAEAAEEFGRALSPKR
jgi:hypothetical protein